MLDLLCTFYDINELRKQTEQLKDISWPVHYVCNWEDKDTVKKVSKECGVEVNWLDFNPGQHLGAFGLASAASALVNSEYVLHYHADMMFDNITKLENIFDEFVKSNKPVGSIPRQWCFDSNNVFMNNKATPFRTELFFMKSDIYKHIFDMDKYEDWVTSAIANGHPSKHFEPIVYAGLEDSGVDCMNDVYYFPTVQELKAQLGDRGVYYNTKFGETEIWRKN